MEIQAVAQGTCTACDANSDNFEVTSREHYTADSDDEYDVNSITRELICDCGNTSTVSITDNGLETEGAISHKNASWNQEESNE